MFDLKDRNFCIIKRKTVTVLTENLSHFLFCKQYKINETEFQRSCINTFTDHHHKFQAVSICAIVYIQLCVCVW